MMVLCTCCTAYTVVCVGDGKARSIAISTNGYDPCVLAVGVSGYDHCHLAMVWHHDPCVLAVGVNGIITPVFWLRWSVPHDLCVLAEVVSGLMTA
ncbi:hypothetical protein ACOMHN_053820 [Nucella lapillus]